MNAGDRDGSATPPWFGDAPEAISVGGAEFAPAGAMQCRSNPANHTMPSNPPA